MPPPPVSSSSGPSAATLLAFGAAVLAVVVVASIARSVTGADTAPGPVAAHPIADDGPLPQGGYTVWERNDDGSPVRWDPCRPIWLVVAPEGAPGGFEADLAVAVAQLRRHSGLDVRVEGRTDERPAADRAVLQPHRYGQRPAPVLVAWAAPHERGLPLRDIDRGVAIPVAAGPPGDRTFVSGQLVLNRDRDELVSGFDDRARSWGATLLHELAHLVGLGHVDEAGELMHVFPGEGPIRFGPGDRLGLHAVGAAGGCRPVADPVSVAVEAGRG